MDSALKSVNLIDSSVVSGIHHGTPPRSKVGSEALGVCLRQCGNEEFYVCHGASSSVLVVACHDDGRDAGGTCGRSHYSR